VEDVKSLRNCRLFCRISKAEEIWLERLEPCNVWIWHWKASKKWDEFWCIFCLFYYSVHVV